VASADELALIYDLFDGSYFHSSLATGKILSSTSFELISHLVTPFLIFNIQNSYGVVPSTSLSLNHIIHAIPSYHHSHHALNQPLPLKQVVCWAEQSPKLKPCAAPLLNAFAHALNWISQLLCNAAASSTNVLPLTSKGRDGSFDLVIGSAGRPPSAPDDAADDEAAGAALLALAADEEATDAALLDWTAALETVADALLVMAELLLAPAPPFPVAWAAAVVATELLADLDPAFPDACAPLLPAFEEPVALATALDAGLVLSGPAATALAARAAAACPLEPVSVSIHL
jgi:hypothetical protein